MTTRIINQGFRNEQGKYKIKMKLHFSRTKKFFIPGFRIHMKSLKINSGKAFGLIMKKLNLIFTTLDLST